MKEETRKKLEYIEKQKEKYRKYSKERLIEMALSAGALWEIADNWGMCEDDYTMHDLYEKLDERYAWDDGWDGSRIILKELYTYTEEDGWIRKEEEE